MIVLLIVALLLILIVLLALKRKKIDLVIARYNEDLDWLYDIDLKAFRKVIIYNKGEQLGPMKHCKIIPLPNVGRCDHTYLYHIIHNYGKLGKVTIFMPASCNMPNKWAIAQRLINHTLKHETSAFFGHRYKDVLKDSNDFKLDEWKASESKNAKANPETKLAPCPERPFGKWYEKNFGNLHITAVAYLGMFCVSKKHIHNRTLESYKKLIKYLDYHSNPEAGHYFERAWLAIFNPVDEEYIIN